MGKPPGDVRHEERVVAGMMTIRTVGALALIVTVMTVPLDSLLPLVVLALSLYAKRKFEVSCVVSLFS